MASPAGNQDPGLTHDVSPSHLLSRLRERESRGAFVRVLVEVFISRGQQGKTLR